METDELAERLFTATLDTIDVLTLHLGDRLGLYRLLHQSGAMTSAEVAAAVPMNERYAREGLEQQTVAGLLTCEDADYLLPVAQLVAAAGVVARAARGGQGALRRRPGRGPGLRCWSSVGIALSYPTATVDGFDLDGPSVEAARSHAEEYGVDDRVRLHHTDAAAVPEPGRGFDLVTAFECVHDLPDPVAFLSAVRRLADDRGTVLVMDARVPERFTGPGDDVERLRCGFSTLICLPDGMSHPGSRATGTVMRSAVLRGYAEEAGFSGVEVLPIENELFRFYRLS